MNARLLLWASLAVFFPAVGLAAPPEGEYYRYWSESDVVAYVAAAPDRYEISGKYVAVMTYEENLRSGQSALIGELFDCADAHYALAEMVEFDNDNNQIRQFSNDNLKKSFRPVEEDTRQEFLFIGVCSEETELPYEPEAMRKYFKLIDESLQAVEK